MAVHKTLDSAISVIKKRMGQVPTRIAEAVNTQAKPFTPVRTGRLISSYEIERNGATELGVDVIAKNDTPYAGYQEFGTVSQAPRAMYRQAVTQISKRGEDYMDD